MQGELRAEYIQAPHSLEDHLSVLEEEVLHLTAFNMGVKNIADKQRKDSYLHEIAYFCSLPRSIQVLGEESRKAKTLVRSKGRRDEDRRQEKCTGWRKRGRKLELVDGVNATRFRLLSKDIAQ